jgi:hypothetical protein
VDIAVTGAQPARRTSPTRRWTARGLVVLIEGVLAGVGGVYLATASIAVTGIAAAVATVVAALVLRTQR